MILGYSPHTDVPSHSTLGSMSQTLPHNAAQERLRWRKQYLEGQRTLKEMAEISPFHYRTLVAGTDSRLRGNDAVSIVPSS